MMVYSFSHSHSFQPQVFDHRYRRTLSIPWASCGVFPPFLTSAQKTVLYYTQNSGHSVVCKESMYGKDWSQVLRLPTSMC